MYINTDILYIINKHFKTQHTTHHNHNTYKKIFSIIIIPIPIPNKPKKHPISQQILQQAINPSQINLKNTDKNSQFHNSNFQSYKHKYKYKYKYTNTTYLTSQINISPIFFSYFILILLIIYK